MKKITFDELRQLLLYRRIVKWNDDRIELDNGVKIRIEMTANDCCGYASGAFKNVVLDAAITSVSEIVREKWEDGDTHRNCRFRVHAGDQVRARRILHKGKVRVLCAIDIALERRFQLRAGLSYLDGLFTAGNLLAPLRSNAYHNGLAHAFSSFHGVSTHSGFLQRISIAHSRFHVAASR